MIRPLASLALGTAFAAVAVSAAPRAAAPAATPFRVGQVEVAALRDAVNVVPNDGKTFGIDQSPAAVAGVLRARGAPADPITLGVDQLLVHLPGHLVLIDTGLGRRRTGRSYRASPLLAFSPTRSPTYSSPTVTPTTSAGWSMPRAGPPFHARRSACPRPSGRRRSKAVARRWCR